MQKIPNPNLPVVTGVSLREKCPYLELFWSVFVIQINVEHGNIFVYDHLFSAITIMSSFSNILPRSSLLFE